MIRNEHLHLLGEKSALERMLAETPDEDVLDRASLEARLATVLARLADLPTDDRAPERVSLTFRGGPVFGSEGIFAEFGAKALSTFADSVTAMAASLNAPLAATGPIRNRDQHQLLITGTALGSFGFELEEYRRPGQLPLSEPTTVAQGLDRTLRLLKGTLGSDDELADSVVDADQRARDKVRAFLQVLLDEEAVCTVSLGDVSVSFRDIGQVKTSIERLSQDNLREEQQELDGEFQGVLPKGRLFEFKRADSKQIVRGKIGPEIEDPHALNDSLHRPTRITVLETRVGSGRPRYVLLAVGPRAAVPVPL